MPSFNHNNKEQESDPGEGDQPFDDGISEVEGFVDPFEDDWDDAEMKELHNEWERMLADSQTEMVNSLQPGATASPPTATGILDPAADNPDPGLT